MIDVISVTIIVLFKDRRPIRSTYPIFSSYIVIGAFFINISIMFNLGRLKTSNCYWIDFLQLTGFSLTAAAIIVKNLRIISIFNSKTKQKFGLYEEFPYFIKFAAIAFIQFVNFKYPSHKCHT